MNTVGLLQSGCFSQRIVQSNVWLPSSGNRHVLFRTREKKLTRPTQSETWIQPNNKATCVYACFVFLESKHCHGNDDAGLQHWHFGYLRLRNFREKRIRTGKWKRIWKINLKSIPSNCLLRCTVLHQLCQREIAADLHRTNPQSRTGRTNFLSLK